MTCPISFAWRARDDMDEIWDYIAEDSPMAADGVIDEFLQAVQSLADHPRMGRCRDELAQGLRSLPVGNYAAICSFLVFLRSF
jgi:toxin ParE1/3/4